MTFSTGVSFQGDVTGDSFQSSNATTAMASDVYFRCATDGGSTDAYFEIDLNATTGYGGIRIKDETDVTGDHDWDMHVHRLENSFNIENNGVPIFLINSSKQLAFDGIGTGFTSSNFISAQAGIQTTNATATTLAIISINSNEMITLRAIINGYTSTFGASIGGDLLVTARCTAGTAIIVGSPVIRSNEDASGTPSFTAVVSGNSLIIQVTGEAATTYNWVTTYDYMKLQTDS